MSYHAFCPHVHFSEQVFGIPTSSHKVSLCLTLWQTNDLATTWRQTRNSPEGKTGQLQQMWMPSVMARWPSRASHAWSAEGSTVAATTGRRWGTVISSASLARFILILQMAATKPFMAAHKWALHPHGKCLLLTVVRKESTSRVVIFCHGLPQKITLQQRRGFSLLRACV